MTKIEPHFRDYVSRYEWLLGLALQLTGGDPARAEDLLHNAYIQFTLPRHELPPVQNLEGYLYTMLRNVHISQERQTATAQHLTVSIADYDSAEITLRAADAWVRVRAGDDLRAICRYACLRKETSKVGSILILRFFHDYFPTGQLRSLEANTSLTAETFPPSDHSLPANSHSAKTRRSAALPPYALAAVPSFSQRRYLVMDRSFEPAG